MFHQTLHQSTDDNNNESVSNHFEIIDEPFEANKNERTTDYHKNYHYQQELQDNFLFNFNFHPSSVDFDDDERQEHIFFENFMQYSRHENFSISDTNHVQVYNEEDHLFQQLSPLPRTDNKYNSFPDSQLANKEQHLEAIQFEVRNTNVRHKRFRSSTLRNINDDNILPSYLLAKTKLFDSMIQQHFASIKSTAISNSSSLFDIEDLRQLAYFLHQIGVYQRFYQLWSYYLQSGLGQLNQTCDKETHRNQRISTSDQSISRPYWPEYIKSLYKKTSQNGFLSTNTMTTDKKDQEQVVYETFARQHIQKCQEKIIYYQKRYEEREYRLNNSYIFNTKQILKTFVEQYGIMPIKMKCDYTIALLHNEYQDYQLACKYQQENPNHYQIEIMKHLYDMEFQLEQVKYDLIIHRYRLVYNKPTVSYDPLDISVPYFFHSISDRRQYQHFMNHYENIIQVTKLNLMLTRFMILDAILNQYQNQFQQQQKMMYENHHSHVPNKTMTPVLLSLIEERSKLMKEKFQLKIQFYINYYLRSPFVVLPENNCVKSGTKDPQQRISFTNNLLIDPSLNPLSSYFTQQQIKLLNRGPTYIIPCQLRMSTSDILSDQYASFQRLLNNLPKTYSIDPSEFSILEDNVKNEFHKVFSTSKIPLWICQRAYYEYKLMESIQLTLKSHHLLLRRTADHNNQFYLMNETTFQEKCQQFMLKHKNDFERLTLANDPSHMDIDLEMKQEILKFNTKLENLFKEKLISKALYEKLYILTNEVELGYLYFLPDISKRYRHQHFHDYHRYVTVVKPMFSMTNSLTWKLSNYIYQLLKPTTRSLFKKMNIIQNENEFIERFYRYCSIEHKLQARTLFVHIKISNYYTMFSYPSIIDRVSYALADYLSNEPIQHLSIATIEHLIELFLKSNLFSYEGQLYRFMHGMPSSFLLTDLLLDLSLYAWQKMIVNNLKLKSEFILRYKNELFFTWNHAYNDLYPILRQIQEKYDEMDMTIDWSRSINFVNIHLENRQGELYTCLVQENEKQCKLLMPYVAGHSTLKYQSWFRSALCRIVQFCSHYQDFIRQRICLEMSCLISGYSVDFIENELDKFYSYFNFNETFQRRLNQNLYEKLRHCLINFISVQHQLLDKKQNELEDQEHSICLSYFYDYGSFRQFEKRFYELWLDFVENHVTCSTDKIKVHLHAKHIFSLNTLLAATRPSITYKFSE